jgi:hypothetical protein
MTFCLGPGSAKKTTSSLSHRKSGRPHQPTERKKKVFFSLTALQQRRPEVQKRGGDGLCRFPSGLRKYVIAPIGFFKLLLQIGRGGQWKNTCLDVLRLPATLISLFEGLKLLFCTATYPRPLPLSRFLQPTPDTGDTAPCLWIRWNWGGGEPLLKALADG